MIQKWDRKTTWSRVIDGGDSLPPGDYELEIEVRVRGYRDPGSWWSHGGVGSPPEGDEEITLERLTLTGPNGPVGLSKEQERAVFDRFLPEIEKSLPEERLWEE